MKKTLVRVGLGLLAMLVLLLLWLHALGAGWLGEDEVAGQPSQEPVPGPVVVQRARGQRLASRALGGAAPEASKQILFGDLHVHTTFSFDAFLLALPMIGGTGSHPPADACDFARYCSGLDFWSINDHAEYLTPRLWRETIESVRQCNAVAGDPRNPDLVSYLGWEWSQAGTTPDEHYGHKNVVFRSTQDARIPTRPIAATQPGFLSGGGPFPPGTATALALLNGKRGRDFARFLASATTVERCPDGVSVRELPRDCREYAATPEALFAKLDDWGYDSIVIPHGTAWGIYTPAGSSWDKQLVGHDPERQRLLEIYSGHGNSEEYRDWRPVERDAGGRASCPEPSAGYLPSCWRAGQLIRARCLELGESAAECERRAVKARGDYLRAHQGGWITASGHGPDSWLDSGQCNDCFQPAFNYRPTGSAQYMMAIGGFDERGRPKRFRFGFIGSSDIHTAKPGTGYKEFWRGEMSEGRGLDPEARPPAFLIPDPGEPVAESVPFEIEGREVRAFGLFENERANAYFYTGGLIAVHSQGRDRDAIFDAMKRKEVYGTSGPRILLWFDLLQPGGGVLPMGSIAGQRQAPRFRVRAIGSFEQQPGCPDYAVSNLAAERLDALCRGECRNPSDRRRPISRIEVIRILPQNHPGEPLAELIQDPWRVFECAPDEAGCRVEFEDPEFPEFARDSVYYARALEAPSLAIHGSNPLGCRYDQSGRCLEVEPCGIRVPASEDCLSDTQQRAWSSPIFVDYR